MSRSTLTLSSGKIDQRVLAVLTVFASVCLAGVGVFASVMAAAWLFPTVGAHMPDHWKAMKFNIVLCDLLAVSSLLLQQPRRAKATQQLGRVLAGWIVLTACAVLLQYALGHPIGIDTLFVSDSLSGHPGRMSQQSAYSFLLLGFTLLFVRERKTMMAKVSDLLAFGLMLLMLTFAFGYLYGAVHLFQLTMENRIGPLTVAGLFPLTCVVFIERAQQGYFNVLISDSIGGKIARLAAPFTLMLPFALATIGVVLAKRDVMQSEYASAFATATVALLALGLILMMTRRIQSLEREIQDLSLRDELTGIYNRRGFNVLASQAFLLAERSGSPFSVLFMDMDGLKVVNDTQGHEVGSELLREMAATLATHFRETDVVGRLGGDEFVVACNAGRNEMILTIDRLNGAIESWNAMTERPFKLRYSSGLVSTDHADRRTLEDLLAEADSMMYANKKARKAEEKAVRGQGTANPISRGSNVLRKG